MSKQTKIQWCDSTVNFWSGCTKVSPGCTNCYAEARDRRHLQDKIDHWGKGAPRLLSESAFKMAHSLNRKPWVCDECGSAFTNPNTPHDAPIFGEDGKTVTGYIHRYDKPVEYHRRRIFSLSLGDWLDDEVPVEWLARMLDTIRQCDQVTWILCTKRPENFFPLMQTVWRMKAGKDPEALAEWVALWETGKRIPQNIILLTSVENQEQADKRIPELLKIPAACRGLSLEPLLGAVDLLNLLPVYSGDEGTNSYDNSKLSWLIVGGESGPKARPCNVEWIRSLVEQGKAAGVATFVKQLGAKAMIDPCPYCGHPESSHQMERTVGCQHGDGSESNPICGCRKMRGELEHGFGFLMAWHGIKDKKGGDSSEWPADLRIQQFPSDLKPNT